MKLNLLVLTLLLTSLSTDVFPAAKRQATDSGSAEEQHDASQGGQSGQPEQKKARTDAEAADPVTCPICLETEEEENGPFITPEAFNGLLTCIHRQVHTTCLTAALAENNRCPICRSAGIRQVQAQVVAQAPTNLHIAVEQGNLAEVNRLIAGGANVNAANDAGNTPLHEATLRGHAAVVQALLAAGANVNAANALGTPLHEAAIRGHAAVVQALITAGANVNATDWVENTPLHEAIDQGHVAVVAVLLATPGININAANGQGFTPSHSAALRGHLQVVEALLAAGANVNATDALGFTPLHMTAEKGHLQVVQALLAAGANVNATSVIGRFTPLHGAAQQGHVAVVQALLNAGADRTIRTSANRTAAQMASTDAIRNLIQQYQPAAQ